MMPNKVIHFKEIIKKMPPNPAGSWHYVDFPENAHDIFGKKGFIKVKGSINDKPFKSNLFPKGNGFHAMTLPLKLQKELGVKLHDEISVALEEDFEERIISMPIELQEAIDFDEEFATLFQQLSASKQKDYRHWIDSAKQTETRIKRVVELAERLRKTNK
ncbi:YdeI/OmpD-associated family protein [Emticicia sp.]|uniref:YdeI/OmpD-associated family protein n=1 Tax=Emticicia sp. TaxID=1930953 RepID=UPI003BADB3F5